MINLKNLKQWSGSGLSANKSLLDFSQQAMNNPTGYLDSLMSNYGVSDIFNKRANNASNLFRNQMSAKGLTGSSFADQKMLSGINDLVGDDMQQYLGNNMNILNSGLGAANNLNSSGLTAENNMQQLQLQQDMFDNEKSQQGNWFTDILKSGLGGIVGGLSGGLGGALGNIATQKLSSSFGKNNPNTLAGANYNYFNALNQNNNMEKMMSSLSRQPSFFSTR
jgi:hypothetical protein